MAALEEGFNARLPERRCSSELAAAHLGTYSARLERSPVGIEARARGREPAAPPTLHGVCCSRGSLGDLCPHGTRGAYLEGIQRRTQRELPRDGEQYFPSLSTSRVATRPWLMPATGSTVTAGLSGRNARIKHPVSETRSHLRLGATQRRTAGAANAQQCCVTT